MGFDRIVNFFSCHTTGTLFFPSILRFNLLLPLGHWYMFSPFLGLKIVMLFVQRQRHQGTKITVILIHSISIIDLIIDSSIFFTMNQNTYHHFVSQCLGGKTLVLNMISYKLPTRSWARALGATGFWRKFFPSQDRNAN